MDTTKRADIDWNLVLKNFLGGAAAGGGVGAGVAYLRNLHSLKTKADNEGAGKNDDTFFIQLPNTPKQAAIDDDNPGNAAAKTLAILLGGVSGYTGVKSLYSKYRMAQAENDVHKNQTLYLSKLRAGQQLQAGEVPGQEGEKAAAGFSTASEMVGGAGAVAVLLALASAVGTNKVLDTKFPAIKNPQMGPKKVMISSAPDQPEPEEDFSEEDKAAALVNASELLVRLHMASKEARLSGMADLLSAVAQGRGDEILDAWTVDPDLAFGLAKQASEAPSNGIHNNLALSWLCTAPETAPSMAKLAAAEFYNKYPWFCKAAAGLPPGIQDGLLMWASSAALKARADAYLPITSQLPEVKFANDGSGILAPLVFLDTASHLLDHKKKEEPDDDDDVAPDKDKGVDFTVTDPQAKSFLKKFKPALETAAHDSSTKA